MSRIRRYGTAFVGAVIAVSFAAAVALAAWTASGSGSGTALATIAQPLVVSAYSLSSGNATLYPGGPAGSVYFSVTNNNPYAITITGLAWGTPTSANPTACANSLISVDAAAPTTANISVPANSTASGIQVNGVLDLSHSATDGCQGNEFIVPVSVTGRQQ